jgi:heme/copper-type cytochrome/quinol oxidase subunit 2
MSLDMSSHLPIPKNVAALDPQAQADARLARLETTLLTVALIITLGVTSALSILVALV